MTPPSRSKSTIEISTVIAEEKKIPTITPGQDQRVDRQTSRAGRDDVHRAAGHEGAGEREDGQPEGFEQPRSKPEDLGQHDAERGPARHAEDGGLGERVARQALKADAGDGEGAAGEERRGDARQAQAQHHDLVDGRRHPVPCEHGHHGASGHRRAAHEEALPRRGPPSRVRAPRARRASGSRALGMDEASELLEAVDHARSVAMEKIAGHGVDAPGLHRGQRREALPLLPHHRPLAMAVAREDDHLGRARDGGLEAIARIPVPSFGRDRHSTGQDEQLRDERASRGHDAAGPATARRARGAAAGPPRAPRRP